MRFKTTNIDHATQQINGTLELTYGYPAGSLIQYIGFANTATNKTQAYVDRLLRADGRFFLYPENDRYRVKIVLDSLPYDKRDTIFGYIEIVKGAFRSNEKSISFYFDEMSIFRGDRNNQIFLKIYFYQLLF